VSPPPGVASPVVSAADLARELTESPAPVVLDVRWRLAGPPGRDSYLAGHLPGAVFIDLDHDLSGPPGPDGRHPLPAVGKGGGKVCDYKRAGRFGAR